jgi:hypothetical protein
MRAAATGVALMLGLLLAGMAQAAESLTTTGARLADVPVDPSGAIDLRRTITVGDDSPSAYYVTANMPDGRRLQRNNLGYWLPWDGRASSLIDNRFTLNSGTVTYKILRQNIGDVFFPITITLAYRVNGTIKFGVFNVLPEQ